MLLIFLFQDGSSDPGDTMLNMHLIATWPKICQAMGVEFEQYLPAVMPLLVHIAITGAPSLECYSYVPNCCSHMKTGKFLQKRSGNCQSLIPKH
jgi:hypothetical protein